MAAATVAEEVVEDDVPLLAGACIAITPVHTAKQNYYMVRIN